MKYFLSVAAFCCCLNILPAQKHILKVAPVKLAASNVAFVYETVFAGRAGFQLETQIKVGFTRDYQDFVQQFSFLPRFEEFDEVDDPVAGTITRGTSVRLTPEYRLYLGKKGPKGFYIPFFIRYINENYSAELSYIDDGVDKGGTGEVKLVTTGAGLGIGYQLVFKNRITLDATFGIGGGWTNVTASTSQPNTTLDERNTWLGNIEAEAEGYPFLPANLGLEVTESGFNLDNLSFIRPMVRSSLMLGVILN